jgi:hypothetical protein
MEAVHRYESTVNQMLSTMPRHAHLAGFDLHANVACRRQIARTTACWRRIAAGGHVWWPTAGPPPGLEASLISRRPIGT